MKPGADKIEIVLSSTVGQNEKYSKTEGNLK